MNINVPTFLSTGGFLTVQATIVVNMVGIHQYPKAQAYFTMAMSIGSLIATPLTGNQNVFDRFNGHWIVLAVIKEPLFPHALFTGRTSWIVLAVIKEPLFPHALFTCRTSWIVPAVNENVQ